MSAYTAPSGSQVAPAWDAPENMTGRRVAIDAFRTYVRRVLELQQIHTDDPIFAQNLLLTLGTDLMRDLRPFGRLRSQDALPAQYGYTPELMFYAVYAANGPWLLLSTLMEWIRTELNPHVIAYAHQFEDETSYRPVQSLAHRVWLYFERSTLSQYTPPSDGLTLYPHTACVLRELNEPRPDRELVFGVELEMECSSVRRTLSSLGGARGPDYICKGDGSLNHGLELVTLPFSLDHHKQAFGWADYTRKCIDSGAKSGSTETCGLHIHANKAALTALQLGKMLVFLNSDNNARFIDTIAQRRPNDYAQRTVKNFKSGKHNSENRYEILNVGSRTVEFRLFRGTLRPDRILKNLEFAHAVIMYCRDASMQELDIAGFGAFLRKNRGTYSNLCRFLQDARDPGFTHMFRPNEKVQVAPATQGDA